MLKSNVSKYNSHIKIPQPKDSRLASSRSLRMSQSTRPLSKSQLDIETVNQLKDNKSTERVLEIHQAMQQVLFSTARVRSLILITPSIIVGQTSKQGQMEFTRLRNVPRYTENIKELEEFFLRTKMHIDGETFMYTRTKDKFILLDNSDNYFSDRGVLFLMPEYLCIFILTFIKTENFIDLPEEAIMCEQKLLTMNFFKDYKDEINGIIPEEKIIEVFNTDFFPQDLENHIRIAGKTLELVQRAPMLGSSHISPNFSAEIEHYKVAVVLYVSPLNPAFEFMIRQLGQIRDFFDGIFTLLVTEGINKNNYKEVLGKCIGIDKLNIALTITAIGEEHTKINLYSLCLTPAFFNRHPHQQVNKSRREIRRREPHIIGSYTDIYEIVRVLEMAYGTEFERANFNIGTNNIEFLGIQHKALNIEQKYQYIIFLFCRQTYLLNHQHEIEAYMSQSCDIVLCVQGNLKFHQNMFLNRFSYLKEKVCILFDENNIFRQLDAIEKQQNDYYIYMFDTKKRYVACNFKADQVEYLQTEFEKALLHIYQFLLQQNKNQTLPNIQQEEFTRLSRRETKSLFPINLEVTLGSLSISNDWSGSDVDFD